MVSSLATLGAWGHHGLQGRAPRAPTGTRRGKAHGENRRCPRSKGLHASRRIGRIQMLRASGHTGHGARVRQDSQLRTGFRLFHAGIRGATSALPWVPSPSVLKPDLGRRSEVLGMRRREGCQI